MTLTNDQFDRVRDLALRLVGIALVDRHRELLARRCRRQELIDQPALDAFLGQVESGDPAARRQLIGLVTTNFTSFFRNPWQFELAAGHAHRAIQRRGTASLWSAGAATGEEPYSLAMALIETTRRDDPPVTILATDVDTDVLAAAKLGEYREPAVRAIEPPARKRFFSETANAGRWRIAEAPRRLVEFRSLNLIDPVWPMAGPFDILFCRNVLMYLDARIRREVLRRIASLIAPGGLLFLDPAEHLDQAEPLFSRGANGVYSRHPSFGAPPASQRGGARFNLG